MKRNSIYHHRLITNMQIIKYFIYFIIILNFKNNNCNSKLTRSSNFIDNFKKFIEKKEISNNYDSQVSPTWNDLIGITYRDLAGLGYVDKNSADSQLAEIKKGDKKDKKKVSYIFRVLFEEQNWEHIGTYTGNGDKHNYSFTVIRHIKKGKVIISFSGTKSNFELIDELMNTNGVKYFRNNYPYRDNVMIMKYFQDLYITINDKLIEFINKAKDGRIKQYIFTGHSLGGAMASVSVFDLTFNSIIPKTKISPVLITYGQPRAGNYAFANELMKNVPIVYRIVNIYDPIPGGPSCIQKYNNCSNEFLKEEIDKNFNDYDNLLKNNLKEKLVRKDTFYPWHFGGLIYIKVGMNPLICGKSEPKNEDQCTHEPSFNADFHLYFFGYRISQVWRPDKFNYDFNNGN